MRATLTIFKKELWSFFVSPIAYCVVNGYLLVSSYLFYGYISTYNEALRKIANSIGFSAAPVTLNDWVIGRYFHSEIFMLIFIIPLLTMRLFAEEKRHGTYEFLMTSPVTTTQIVLGKFSAVTTVVCIMLLLSFIFPAWICYEMQPEIIPALVGAGCVILCSISFVAFSMIAACFSENQIVSGMISSTMLLLLYVLFAPASSVSTEIGAVLRYLSPGWEANEFINGVLGLKGIVYFISLIVFGLFTTKRILDSERWR